MLTAVGRFMADPTREECELERAGVHYGGDYEAHLHVDDNATEKDLRLIRQMVESCRRMFSTVLGFTVSMLLHGYSTR